LPEYMVPGVYVRLEELPLTANGKVDRARLPNLKDVASGREYEMPRTAVEEVLCAIWEEVLGLQQVGINDNFFELGGHSLLAIQIVSQVRTLLYFVLTLRDLFAAPTVAEIAQLIASQEAAPGRTEKIAAIWKKLQTADSITQHPSGR
jgi:acyl carrier protein